MARKTSHGAARRDGRQRNGHARGRPDRALLVNVNQTITCTASQMSRGGSIRSCSWRPNL
eukprot:2598085-Pleurochrysis_carterae.AAC.1